MRTSKSFMNLWPLAVFLFFCVFIVSIFLYYAPSWGFMDDIKNLNTADKVFKSDSVFLSLNKVIIDDLYGWGTFKPVYHIYVVVAYHFLKNSPLTIYILMALFNMIALAIWGYLFHVLFSGDKQGKWQHIFLFPLSFLIFTPFWNNFMYISMQQKFVIMFSALAILFFFKAFSVKKKAYMFLSLFFSILSTCAHPEGVFIILAFIGCIMIDALINRKIDKFSFISFIMYSLVFAGYYVFTVAVQMSGVYTSRYKSGFNIDGIIASISSSSITVKGILLIAIVALAAACLRGVMKKKIDLKAHIILPLSILSYIIILAPWGFPNYHLSTLAPFVLGIFFPLYVVMNRAKLLRYANSTLIITLSLAACVYIAMPRIAKMAQKAEISQFVKEYNDANSKSIYFATPPLYEASAALSHFSGAQVLYLSVGTFKQKDLHKNMDNYLVFSDESNALNLDGVKVSEQIYANDTWRIFKVDKQKNYKDKFIVRFKQNSFQKLVSFLKKS